MGLLFNAVILSLLAVAVHRVCGPKFGLLAFALTLVAMCASVSAYAQALPVGVSPVFAPTVTSTGITYAGGVASSANAASITFANPANGAIYAQATQRVALGSGATADLVLRSTPTAVNVAGAVGRFALKVAGPLYVGVALYDLAKELGFTVGRDTSGSLAVQAPGALYIPGWGDCATWTQSAYGQAGRCVVSGQYSGRADYPDFCYFQPTGTNDLYGGWACGPGASVPSTVQALQDAIAAKSGWPSGSALPRVLDDAIRSGETLPLPQPDSITGPGTVALPPTVETKPDGSTVTTTPSKALTYNPPSVSISSTTTAASTDVSGNPSGTTSTSGPNEMPETCGYPGGPPCKIDETGTPDKVEDTKYDSKADALKAPKDSALNDMKSDKSSLFSGWAVFFSAPPVAACEAFVMPTYMGWALGSIDACPVVDGVRTLMGWLWGLSALFLCLGMVRQTIQLG